MKHPLVLLPDERRRYRRHQFWTDHGIFRELFYANFHEIAPGVFRSAQPSPVQLRHWQQKHGLCTVLNLRAPAPHEPHYRLEQETCDALGMTHLTLHGFGSRGLPERDKLLAGIEVLDQLPQPFLLMQIRRRAVRCGDQPAIIPARICKGQRTILTASGSPQRVSSSRTNPFTGSRPFLLMNFCTADQVRR